MYKMFRQVYRGEVPQDQINYNYQFKNTNSDNIEKTKNYKFPGVGRKVFFKCKLMNRHERLLIHKVVAVNFKTYADEIVLGPFDHCFSAVVGPNGSGKSNLIDAICFVFGIRASKLRHKNVTNLIHSSTNYKPTFCRVTVHFLIVSSKNCDRLALMDHKPQLITSNSPNDVTTLTEVKVTREYYVNSVSKYYLNNKACKFSDIAGFLESYGVVLTNCPFLVLQGEVERLSLLPPKAVNPGEDGLLQVMERLIGSDKLIPLIEETQNQIDDTQESLDEHNKMVERKKQAIRLLKPQLQKALKFINAQKQITCVKADLVAKQRSIVRLAINDLENELLKLDEQRQVLLSTIEKNLAEQSDLTNQIQICEAELVQVTDTSNALRKQRTKLESEVLRVQNQLDLRLKEIDALNNKISNAEKRIADQEQKINDLENDYRAAPKSVEQLRVDIVTLNKEIQDIDARLLPLLDSIRVRLSEADTELEQLNNSYVDAKNCVSSLEAEYNIVDKEINDDKRLLDLLKSQLAAQRQEIHDKAVEVNNLILKKNAFEEQISNLDSSISSIDKKIETLQSANNYITQLFNSYKSSKSTINNIILFNALSKEFANPSSRLYSLGVFLLDQISVDACKFGKALDSAGLNEELIVTEDNVAAETIISFVRERKLGKVTCLVRNKITESGELLKQQLTALKNSGSLPFLSPGELTLLIDEVSCKHDLIEPILYSRIGRTLLCHTSLGSVARLDLPQNLKFLIVTLNGEVIDPSGTMTGGASSNYLLSRVMPPPCNVEELDRKRNELEQNNVEVSLLQENKQKLLSDRAFVANSCLSKITADIDTVISEGQELEKLVASTKKSLKTHCQLDDAAASAKQELLTRREMISTQLVEARSKLDEINSAREQLIRRRKDLIDEQHRITDTEREATARKLKQCETKLCQVENILENYSSLRQQIIDSIDQVRRDELLALQENRQKLYERRDELILQQSTLSASLESIRREILSLPVVNEFKDKITELYSIRKSYDELKSDCEKELRQLDLKIREFRNALSLKQQEESTLSTRIQRFSEEFNGYNAKMFDVDLNHLNSYIDLPNIADSDSINIASNIMQSENYMNDGAVAASSQLDNNEMTQLSLVAPPMGVSGSLTLSGNDLSGACITFPEVDNDDNYVGRDLLEFQVTVDRVERLLSGDCMADLSIFRKFQESVEEHDNASRVFTDTKNKLLDLINRLDQLKNERLQKFEHGFKQVAAKTKQLYRFLTLSGDADLEYGDINVFDGGLRYTVRPPGKSWRPIRNLSGGEKTISSLALLFAMQSYSPMPFYFLDELDAALDMNNVILIACYIADFQCFNCQFIVITQRHELFQRVNVLIGLVKRAGCTTVYRMDLTKYDKADKLEDDVEPAGVIMKRRLMNV